MKNMKKDIQRGQGCNCDVLQEGNSSADHAHVSRTTPFQTKVREITSDPQYQADAIAKAREMRTTAKRRDKETRPL
jgi:hypothetical protein